MTKSILLATALFLGTFGTAALAQTAPLSASLVPGSDSADFNIRCWDKEGKLVWGVYERPGISDFNVARNIVLAPLGNGRIALHFVHGFTSANQPGTYLPAADERCEATKK